MTTGDLFSGRHLGDSRIETLAEGAAVLRGFAAGEAANLVAAVETISATAAFRHMVTPSGFSMSVAMSVTPDSVASSLTLARIGFGVRVGTTLAAKENMLASFSR